MPPSGSTDASGARPDRLRTHAIELYCRELCGSDRTAAATDNAVRSISPADAWGGDDQLLRVTRSAAASHVPPRAAPAGWRGMLAAEHQSECDPTPALLAQRANGELPPSLQFKLENHLARCLFCRAAEVREERASRAFSAVLATGPPASRRAPAPAQPDPGAEAVADPPTAVIPVEPAPPPAPVAEPSPLPEPPSVHEEALTADATAPARRGMVVYPAARDRAATPSQGGRTGVPGGLAAVSAYRPFLLTLVLGVVVIVAVALALGGGANGQSSAASLPPPSALSTPPPNVGIAVTRKAQKPHPTPKPKPAAATATTPTVTTTTPAATSTPQASAAPPASSPAPAASAPAPAANNSPAASSPSQTNSGSGGGSSGSQPIVATQQGTGLPAQSAPTQGIGGGTPTTK